MSGDKETLEFYDARAAEYAAMPIEQGQLDSLTRFIDRLPKGGAVLDLGCGHGWAAGVLAGRGFTVDATDGAPGMVDETRRRTGLDARVMRFDELDSEAAYDGVWASFSLLHAPRADVPALLDRVRRSLRPRGALFVGVKSEASSVERRDSLGRFYAYYSRADLEALLAAAGFDVLAVTEGRGVGMDGVPSDHLLVQARRRD